MKKFKKDYPAWKQKYSTKVIIKELIKEFSLRYLIKLIDSKI